MLYNYYLESHPVGIFTTPYNHIVSLFKDLHDGKVAYGMTCRGGYENFFRKMMGVFTS